MKLKDEFPLTKKLLYFDNAVMGCVPQSTLDLIESNTQALLAHMRGDGDWGFNIEEWSDAKANAKKLFSKVIGAEEEEVACMPNASTGINAIFSMLPVKKGDNVVSTDLAFPMGAVVVNNQTRRGAEARFLKGDNGIVETEQFEKAIDDDTAIVYLDQTGWFNGYLFDLKTISELTHDHGAYLVVDATQTMGAIDWKINEKGVDFAATSTYKWLLGGIPAMSTGFLYMNKEHIDSFHPTFVGGGTMDKTQAEDSPEGYTVYDFKPRPGIGKYEIFRGTDFSYSAVADSMKVLLDHGMKNIEKQNKKLGTRLVEGFIENGLELQTPVEEERRTYVNVKVPDPGDVVKKLAAQNMVASQRIGGMRVAPNFYNTLDEVDRFIEAVMKII